jgi:hypothetical protein
MAEPKLAIELHLDRIEEAIKTLALEMDIQTGFTNYYSEDVEAILNGSTTTSSDSSAPTSERENSLGRSGER